MRSCGTELRENAKFCDECGAPAAASVDAAKYKQVTVLFADVVRSMDIAAAVDVERLREIMTELVDRSAAVVHRYGGTVEQSPATESWRCSVPRLRWRTMLFGPVLPRWASRRRRTGWRRRAHRDGVALRLRVGLNSGRVIAGEIGSGSLGYAAIGEQVGMAQRMESVAPPGGVMLTESTARLVEHTVTLAEAEEMRIKGGDEPVLARRLVRSPTGRPGRRAEAALVGRRWEMATIDAFVDRQSVAAGVWFVLPDRRASARRDSLARLSRWPGRGVEVFSVFCESHASDVPFCAAAGLLREAARITDLDDEAARAQVRALSPPIPTEDLLLLYDLMGIETPKAPPPIDPDARRRRLTALINSLSLARTEPALYVIEDAHWIDAVSESMLADLLTVIPHTPSMVLITYRPDYDGALARVPGAQTISLAPLSDSETAALLDELLGTDPSVAGINALVAERAGGNPFFAQEMVRELAERAVLEGDRGGFTCRQIPPTSPFLPPCRPPSTRASTVWTRSQADAERRGGDRLALHARVTRRAGQ